MRHGVVISAVGHVTAILLAVLFTGANPFDSVATEAIAVDIISPGEVPQPQTNAPETPPGPPQESPPDVRSPVRSGPDAAFIAVDGNEGVDGRKAGAADGAGASQGAAKRQPLALCRTPSGREAAAPRRRPGATAGTCLS